MLNFQTDFLRMWADRKRMSGAWSGFQTNFYESMWVSKESMRIYPDLGLLSDALKFMRLYNKRLRIYAEFESNLANLIGLWANFCECRRILRAILRISADLKWISAKLSGLLTEFCKLMRAKSEVLPTSKILFAILRIYADLQWIYANFSGFSASFIKSNESTFMRARADLKTKMCEFKHFLSHFKRNSAHLRDFTWTLSRIMRSYV